MSALVVRMHARVPAGVAKRAGIVLLCWMVAVAYGVWLTKGGVSGIPCLWQMLFGVECPGCGLTHAWVLLLRGDLTAAAGANWLIFPVIAVFLHHSFVFAARRQPLPLATMFNP
ncbi:MAG TPA: DUF2752 domain-containing protein [Rhizomicrobium sp.]|nr:DUF2752 domain-containing protein [Rhizomicrobium sp.]